MTKHSALCMAGLLFAAPALAATAVTHSIDGRQVELVAIKHPQAAVTVVFENGSRATVDTWDKVIDGIAPQAKTIVVDSDHQMQTASPQVVVDAIQEIIAAQHK